MDQDNQTEATNPLQDNGDELWLVFSSFLEKIYAFCNQNQDLLTQFSNVNCSNLIDNCLNNPNLVQSIEQFTATIFKELNARTKDDLEAKKLRKDGNDLFKEKMYSDALESYSAAILKASQNDLDNDHNECSLCFANRSACFFNLRNFKYAQEDAERALKLGHYDKDKLNSRIEKCRSVLRQIEDQIEMNEPDELNQEAFTNEKISLDVDEKKGRKLVANKTVEMGEVLIREDAFVSMVNSDYYLAFCNHCLKQLNGYGVPCTECDYAIYCTEECLKQATYHKDECGKLSDLVNQLGVAYIILRLVFKVGFNEMINQLEDDSISNNGCQNSNELTSTYKDVYNLMTHENEFDPKENLSFALVSIFLKQLLANHSRHILTDSQTSKLCKLFMRHIQQLSTNLISIDQQVALDVYSETDKEMNEKLKVGIGFYPIVSLLNHSCVPNVMPKFYGNRIEIAALKLIEKDNEILFCYGPSFFEDTRSDRQKMLKSQYFFDCECSACESNEENKQRCYLCSACHGPVIMNKDKSTFCLNCKSTNQTVNTKLFDESMMLIRIAKRKFGLKKYEDALTDINEAYAKLIECVHRHHSELRTCLDLLANCYQELGHYSVASQYLKVNFKLVKEIFGLKSVESLVVFMRICNLDYLSLNDDLDKARSLKEFISMHLDEFESLEKDIEEKLANFKGFEEIKVVKEINSKINC